MSIYEEEELDVMDPLRALAENAQRMNQMREARYFLTKQALDQGYSYLEIGHAMGVTDTAIRLYAHRRGIK